MAKKLLRIHELAKELGMTNQETLDLCAKLSIGVKGLSSTIIEQQADRVRARAERDGPWKIYRNRTLFLLVAVSPHPTYWKPVG